MNTYSESNPPKRGTALKIWRALKQAGYTVIDLHYNPNLWNRDAISGWGTWACTIESIDYDGEFWCGWDDNRGAYLQIMWAPYSIYWLVGPVEGE